MPIYEYQCEGCGHQLEAMQSIKDAPLVNCPECHEDRLRKQISAAGFRLKGSGWYVTDFRDGGRKKESAAGGKDSARASDGDGAGKATGSGEATSPAAPAAGEGAAAAKPASGGGSGEA